MSQQIAFIGLGVMGYPMAGHLIKAGHHVTVSNRTQAKADQWTKEFGGTTMPSPRQAALGADFVFVCVGNDNDVRQVLLGDDGALAGMHEGAVLVDHTTTSALLALELHDLAQQRAVKFMDAPVSGGEAGAVNGQLTIMLGGSAMDFAMVEPVIAAYAKSSQLIGSIGDGQKAKMVNQICIAGLVQSLAEGLHFAQRSGLDVEKVIAAISKGAAQSWQMENRYQAMVASEFDFGFAVDWMRKDLGIALNEARRLEVDLPVTELVDGYYKEVQELGGGRFDTCSLIKRFHTNQASD